MNDRLFLNTVINMLDENLTSPLREISEYTQWSLVKTEQHRPAMLDLIRQSRKRIVIGSDAVRKGGLDLSTIREISSRPRDTENRASKFTVQIFWGRQDPGFVRAGDEEIEDARSRIKLLKEEVWKQDDRSHRGSLRSKFLPLSLDPMLTHCKFISIDDERLLLTSDNLLSFSKDDEGWDSDARELGILIDNPRISRIMRGELELLTPTCRDHWDRGRWHAAVGSVIDECGGHSVPIEQVMTALIERVRGINQLSEDWFAMTENMKQTYRIDDSEVAYALVMEGVEDGLYNVNKIADEAAENLSHNDSRFHEITLSDPHHHGLNQSWKSQSSSPTQEKIFQPPLKLPSDDDFDFRSFSEALIDEMADPNEWTEFSNVYNKMITNHPEFKMRRPSKKLGNCDEYLEVTHGSDHPYSPLIRRRQA